jgi:hypothetical protein
MEVSKQTFCRVKRDKPLTMARVSRAAERPDTRFGCTSLRNITNKLLFPSVHAGKSIGNLEKFIKRPTRHTSPGGIYGKIT